MAACGPGKAARQTTQVAADAPALRTDRARYFARERVVRGADGSVRLRLVELIIPFTYTNSLDRPVYVESCAASVPPPRLHRKIREPQPEVRDDLTRLIGLAATGGGVPISS